MEEIKTDLCGRFSCFVKQKRALANALFFISALAFLGLIAASGALESERLTKMAMVAARAGALLVLLIWASFFSRALERTLGASKKWMWFCAVPLALLFGALAASRFIGAAQDVLPLPPIASSLSGALLALASLPALCVLSVMLLLLFCDAAGVMKNPPPLPVDTKKTRVLGLLFAAICPLVTLVLGLLIIDRGQNWGQDFATYLVQAIDLAAGRFDQMRAAWGYSAMLVPIYQLFGYDRATFSTLILYKIPGVLCLALTVPLLYQYYKKRFPLWWAVVLTLCLAVNPVLFSHANNIVTNVPHLFFSMLAILCLYRLFESETRAGQIKAGVCAGLFIWYSDMLRANGVVLLLTLACMHALSAVYAVSKKRSLALADLTRQARIRFLPAHALPYVVWFALKLVFSSILPDSGTETSILSETTLTSFLSNIKYYAEITTGFFAGITRAGLPESQLIYLWLPLTVLGVIASIKRDALSIVYLLGTTLLLLLLVYRQGDRYIMPIMPMLLFFAGQGLYTLVLAIRKRFGKSRRRRAIALLLTLFLLVNLGYASGKAALTNLQSGRAFDEMSYSEDAKDVYRYIQTNTEQDAQVVYNKYRVVTLNTDRNGVSGIGELDRTKPAYYLHADEALAETQPADRFGEDMEAFAEANGITLTLVYQNARYRLFAVTVPD